MKPFFFINSFIIFFFAGASLYAQDNYNTLIYKGNQAFNSKNYGGAAAKYSEAAKIKEKDFTAHYNLGNALYKQQKFDEAKAEYEKAKSLAQLKSDRMAAMYNLGNVEMQSQNHEKAAEMYKEALKWDPYNESARKNYQIAMLKDKEQKQKNGGGGGGKGGKNQNEEQDKNGKSQQQGGDGKQQNGQGGQGDKPEPNQQRNNAGSMPKDVQDEIMRKVKGKESETARKILNRSSYSVPQSNEKDW